MYIKTIKDENVGPIENIKIDFPFNADGQPKPIIFVGENGSGKSLLLSNIVDSFYSIASIGFDNAMEKADNGGELFYKNISPSQIKIGKNYLYSYIKYTEDALYYIFKSGNLSVEDFKKLNNCNSSVNDTWKTDANYKNTNVTEEQSTEIFSKNVICYFGPDRYEKPSWLGDKYYSTVENEHITLNTKMNRHLNNPISIKGITESNLKWLLDIIVDSRTDVEQTGENLNSAHVKIADLLSQCKARKNLEDIMSKILEQEVYFNLNLRNRNAGRLEIKSKATNKTLAPSLDALSTGQLALFNMFSTIIRYADDQNINNSIHIKNITGIVVIDEIELHLHPSLQKEVLPNLLKLFPNIQFIITTHSPLFLLGMEDTFEKDNYEIYELPTANRIDVESFSEFQHAYNYFTQTQTHRREIRNAINNTSPKKALIITEGATDWKHMKSAYQKIKNEKEYANLNFEFLEYEPLNSGKEGNCKLEMGNSHLCSMCEEYAKLPQTKKLIFIADCDDDKTNKKLQENNKLFKKWSNDVYSFTLPIPEHRKETPAICIEHYYSDEEIKTSKNIDGIDRRLYLGGEFDCRGINIQQSLYCGPNHSQCRKDSIHIIDGDKGEKVTSFEDTEKNLALPKMVFAESVLNNEKPFSDFNIDAFYKLFDVIKAILEDK